MKHFTFFKEIRRLLSVLAASVLAALSSIAVNAEELSEAAMQELDRALASPETGDIALLLTTVALFCVSVVVALLKHRRNKYDK